MRRPVPPTEVFMKLRMVVTLGVVTALIAACSGGGGDSTGPGGSNNGNNNGSQNQNPTFGTVTVGNNVYTPGTFTLANGGTVQWNWSSCSSGGIYGDEVCVA